MSKHIRYYIDLLDSNGELLAQNMWCRYNKKQISLFFLDQLNSISINDTIEFYKTNSKDVHYVTNLLTVKKVGENEFKRILPNGRLKTWDKDLFEKQINNI